MKNKLLSKFAMLIVYSFLLSCVSTEDERAQYIREANIHLTKLECDKALAALAKAGASSGYHYITTLASAYACRSGFNELTFFDEDIANLDAQSFFNSLSTFSTSDETSVESDSYSDLKTAIETILYVAGEGNPRVTDRYAFYGERYANDLHMQLLYMLLAHMGKWLQFYGNTNAAGTKGAGTAPNNCLYTYTDPPITPIGAILTAANTYSCTNPPTGHAALNTGTQGAAAVNRRVCDFIVNMNVVRDILAGVTISANTSNGEVGDVLAELDTLMGTLPAAVADLFTLYNYSDCQDYAATHNDEVQQYLVLFIEANFQ